MLLDFGHHKSLYSQQVSVLAQSENTLVRSTLGTDTANPNVWDYKKHKVMLRSWMKRCGSAVGSTSCKKRSNSLFYTLQIQEADTQTERQSHTCRVRESAPMDPASSTVLSTQEAHSPYPHLPLGCLQAVLSLFLIDHHFLL